MYSMLIVDDEPLILEGIKEIINWNDYGIELVGLASNGEKALEILNRRDVQILLTDISMPIMNGLELIRAVKGMKPHVKLIVLSGYNDFDYLKECMQLGIENYLLKPVIVQELRSTIVNCVQKLDNQSKQYAFLKTDVDILRDNILSRWVTNNISSFELKERATLLKINLDYAYYFVCILKILYENDGCSKNEIKEGNYLKEAYAFCRNMLAQIACALCFCEISGNIVIILGENNDVYQKEYFEELYNKLINGLQACCKLNAVITVGNRQDKYADLHSSYKDAKELLELNQLTLSKSRFVYSDSTCLEQSFEGVKPDYHALSKLILAEKTGEVMDFIDNLFLNFEENGSFSSLYILNMSIELILQINKTIENLDVQADAFNDYSQMFKKLFETNSLSQIKEYIKEITRNAINCKISNDNKINPTIRQVLKYIEAHYNEDISLKILCKIFKINPTYLGRLFQKETGEAFTSYLNKYKMRKAKQFILNTNLSVPEISRKIGLYDMNYFYKLFKKYCGVSPTEFKSLRKP